MTSDIYHIRSKQLFFLALICSFFSINKLAINPVYLIGFPLVLISFGFTQLNQMNKYQLLYYVYFLLVVIGFYIGTQEFKNVTYKVEFLSSILYSYCILLGAQTVNVGLLTTRVSRIKVYNAIYNFLIFYMTLDLIIRVVMSQGIGTFYDFKWGLFYFDSNFSALIILLFLMFSIYLNVNKIYDIGKIRFIFLTFLLFTTFSRAAIFAFVVSYLLLRYVKKIITYLVILFSIFALYIFYNMVMMYTAGENFVDIDGSFNSKFYIISVALDNYGSLSFINKMFGIGMANFPYFSDGIFAHNLLVTLVYEFGLWGITSFLIFILLSYRMVGKDLLYILLPFFIAGFSLFSAFMPFFFVLMACIYIEKLESQRAV